MQLFLVLVYVNRENLIAFYCEEIIIIMEMWFLLKETKHECIKLDDFLQKLFIIYRTHPAVSVS